MYHVNEPNATPYDLRFRLFGVPIRVHPYFWAFMALIGWWPFGSDLGLVYWLIFIACGFVSVVVHELGHALMFRFYGVWSSVVLLDLGGVTVPEATPPWRSQRILVSLAGPVAGFLLLTLVYFSNRASGWAENDPRLAVVYLILYSMNLYWGLINLMPIWPLDGGMILREVCTYSRPRDGLIVTLWISAVTATVYAVYCGLLAAHAIPIFRLTDDIVLPGGMLGAILFGLLAFRNWQNLFALRAQQRNWSGWR